MATATTANTKATQLEAALANVDVMTYEQNKITL